MAKGSGSTKTSTSRNPKGVSNTTMGGGSGVARGNEFSGSAKINQFYGSGGYYTMTTKDGKYTMTIETENGYNDELRTNGTTIMVSIQKGTGRSEYLTNSFVEPGTVSRESMGREFYGNDSQVVSRINGSMPYFAELANKWIKRNK